MNDISGMNEQNLVEPGAKSSGGGMASGKGSGMGIGGNVEPRNSLAEPKSPKVSKKPSGGDYSPNWTKGKG